MSRQRGNPAITKGGPALPGAGRPPGSTNKVKNSKLRKTLNKLREIEDKALENIAKNVRSEEVDKEVLASSKWVITTLVTVQKACVAEEEFKNKMNEDDEEPEKVEPSKPKFSMEIRA